MKASKVYSEVAIAGSWPPPFCLVETQGRQKSKKAHSEKGTSQVCPDVQCWPGEAN